LKDYGWLRWKEGTLYHYKVSAGQKKVEGWGGLKGKKNRCLACKPAKEKHPKKHGGKKPLRGAPMRNSK